MAEIKSFSSKIIKNIDAQLNAIDSALKSNYSNKHEKPKFRELLFVNIKIKLIRSIYSKVAISLIKFSKFIFSNTEIVKNRETLQSHY